MQDVQDVQDVNREPRRQRGRLPADEAAEKREREIAALKQVLAETQQRLAKKEADQRRHKKSMRRAYVNERKYAVGGLAQIAGLLGADPGFVLGALLYVADDRERDGTWPGEVFEKYKSRGDAELSARAAARKQRKRSKNADTDDDDED